jgi:hypothetical protein
VVDRSLHRLFEAAERLGKVGAPHLILAGFRTAAAGVHRMRP